MKFLITKSQYNILKEVTVNPGKFSNNSQGEAFSAIMNYDDIPVKDLINKVKRYFKTVAYIDISKMSDQDILAYLNSLKYESRTKKRSKLYSIGIVSGLSYYLSKSFKKLTKNKYGLEYYVESFDSFVSFWFFDPEIRDFVGRIVCEESDILPNSISITLSEVDRGLIGQGYGTKIYLSLLEKYKYVMSDKILYNESLNMWVNSLPRYCNVWAKLKNEEGFFKITNKDFISPDLVKYYVASYEKDI